MNENNRQRREERFRRFGSRNVEGEFDDEEQPEYGWSQYHGQPFPRGYGEEEYHGTRRDWMHSGYYGRSNVTDFPSRRRYDAKEAWQVPGPYSGRAPRRYKRPDEFIHQEVWQRLALHGMIDATDIEIEVDQGEVTLLGTVPNRQVKRMAEDTAESVAGVRDVHNRLRIQHYR